MSALETAKFRQLNQLIKTTMHLHRAFFMPIQTAFLQQSGNFAGKEHHEPGISRRRRDPSSGCSSSTAKRRQSPTPSWANWPSLDAGAILAGMVSGLASTGLHQSSGWKIAEYLAAGRAIVSEPLCYEVPGPFQAGENYLTYTSADGCIEQIRTLLAHPEQILQMGQRNRAYYDTWLRPDQIVTKALEQAKILL